MYSKDTIRTITEKLVEWYHLHGRKFPWREPKYYDPLKILIVEILLQRTRAENVVKVAPRILAMDVKEILEMDVHIIKETFLHLGLSYRGQRLIDALRVIRRNGTQILCDFEQLLNIKGVGVYIASAVLNFGCGKPVPVVDVNVMRVINSLTNIVKESESRNFIKMMFEYGDHRIVSYALIDLGAMICTLRNRKCEKCPLRNICPRYPLRPSEWKMLRKVRKNGKIILREQPVKSSLGRNVV